MTAGHQITAPDQALKFILAGKATFTVRSEKTGNHLTFQVRSWKKAKYGTMHFVSVRAGTDYAKIGVIRDGNQLKLGGESDLPYADPRVRAFLYVFGSLKQNVMPPKAAIWHEGARRRPRSVSFRARDRDSRPTDPYR